MGADAGRWLGPVLLLAAACGGDEAEARAGDGTLWLEVGGDHQRLGGALAEAAERPAPTPPQPSPATDAPEGEGVPQGAGRTPVPLSAPDPGDPPTREVVLGAGENLYQLALVHLRNGNRWREIMRLNGWTEAQIVDLPEGTRVRLPVE